MQRRREHLAKITTLADGPGGAHADYAALGLATYYARLAGFENDWVLSGLPEEFVLAEARHHLEALRGNRNVTADCFANLAAKLARVERPH